MRIKLFTLFSENLVKKHFKSNQSLLLKRFLYHAAAFLSLVIDVVVVGVGADWNITKL